MNDVSLRIQVPPQKVLGPSKPTSNTFSEGTIGSSEFVEKIIRGACKNDSHFFLTLSFLVSDANDIDTKEEGEEKDEDALSFPIHL